LALDARESSINIVTGFLFHASPPIWCDNTPQGYRSSNTPGGYKFTAQSLSLAGGKEFRREWANGQDSGYISDRRGDD